MVRSTEQTQEGIFDMLITNQVKQASSTKTSKRKNQTGAL